MKMGNLTATCTEDCALVNCDKEIPSYNIVLNNHNYDYLISNPNSSDCTSGDLTYFVSCHNLGRSKKSLTFKNNKNIMNTISKMVNLQGHDCVNKIQSIEYNWGLSSGFYILPCKLFKIKFPYSGDDILIEYSKKSDVFSFYYYLDDLIVSDFITDIQKNIE